jgi:TM2 domain-containing membrane protein YozV
MESSAGTPGAPRRSPALAQVLSIVPGLGQLYYGAAVRGLQYFAGTVTPAALLAVLFAYNELLAWRLVGAVHPLLRLFILLFSELLELTLLIVAVSFWIAAWHDAKQGMLARNAGAERHPTWWFVKVKQFLFDDPETEEAAPHE